VTHHRPPPPPPGRKRPAPKRPLREDLVTQTCLEVYAAVRHEGKLADRVLEQVLRSRKHLYSLERRTVAERIYALLRRQRLVDFLAERAVRGFGKLATSQKDLWRLAIVRRLEGEDPSAIVEALSLSGPDARLLKGLETHLEALAELSPLEHLAIEASLPDFLARRLMAELGDEARAAAVAMNVRAPLTVRTNTLKTTREELQKRLEKEDVVVRPTPLSPFGLFLETRINVYSLPSFREGLFEVQDEGSQLLGMLVDAPPRKVVDACAGAGGKSLQLAAQMKNRGDLFALDVVSRRLEDLRLRARRAGVHNIRVQRISEGPEALDELKALHGAAERVLVDAPCTGTGTFRRKPDARYRLEEQSLAEHVEKQKALLERFSALVKPGGRLIYGTCSILVEENEQVVQDFLSRHPEFSLAPAEKWLGPELGAQVTQQGMLRLYTHRHGTDGFFGAVLVKQPA
jgi:16S rRNA (cytosine967-C5)-methyltransferase